MATGTLDSSDASFFFPLSNLESQVVAFQIRKKKALEVLRASWQAWDFIVGISRPLYFQFKREELDLTTQHPLMILCIDDYCFTLMIVLYFAMVDFGTCIVWI
ncbi:uncharacterized protein LOC111888042 [Lactuca sativa]|uniref:uncharacterized protein LOC111888042 n=1 Tax=Lactuca sativa TaxID=4236 RepID=UPI000CD966A4|nr:uncharacterized protein LOC111888042 [Lactuca sativa]